MNRLAAMLADSPALPRGLDLPDWLKQALIIFGSLTLVTLLVVLWAALIRKRPREHRRHHHPRAAESMASKTPEAAPPAGNGRVRHRRRRSSHPARPLNPTLAESRGLPPLRDRSKPPAGL